MTFVLLRIELILDPKYFRILNLLGPYILDQYYCGTPSLKPPWYCDYNIVGNYWYSLSRKVGVGTVQNTSRNTLIIDQISHCVFSGVYAPSLGLVCPLHIYGCCLLNPLGPKGGPKDPQFSPDFGPLKGGASKTEHPIPDPTFLGRVNDLHTWKFLTDRLASWPP